MTLDEVIAAVRAIPPENHYVWDGQDEDDRPMTAEEKKAALAAIRKPGRPKGSAKTTTTIRLDDEVLEAFRATGKGWQTRVNDVLKEWLATHQER
ncbi:hypothetical protein DDT56_15270 [Brenneria corticis]|uniref:Toxin-antitoxin system, antitoxin component n=2 Tax=Pectobacteriaceae TaxID=1903410 RepID=A0A2U1TVI4_9GAMM|nr:hypothetical protein DDT56_15270 [Brenneria sp. CFCC 11842]